MCIAHYQRTEIHSQYDVTYWILIFIISGRNVRDCFPVDIIQKSGNAYNFDECYRDCSQVGFTETVATNELMGESMTNFQESLPDSLPKFSVE